MTNITPNDPKPKIVPDSSDFLRSEGMAFLQAYRAISEPHLREAVRNLVGQIAEVAKKLP